MTKIIYTASNPNDGIEARITKGDFGYHVQIFDVDANEYVQAMKCFEELRNAKEYANRCTLLHA